MTNMRRIAKEAGVGIATVSRYINNTGYVSDELKKKSKKRLKERIIDLMNWRGLSLIETPKSLVLSFLTYQIHISTSLLSLLKRL